MIQVNREKTSDSGDIDLDGEGQEYDFGWVFYWNSTEYIKTGDRRDSLVGNAPIVVTRTGKVESLGDTSSDPEEQIEERITEWKKIIQRNCSDSKTRARKTRSRVKSRTAHNQE